MAKTKIGVLSNMVNKPVKVFTTFASVDQIEQANGKLPSTSFIVASEVDTNNEDTGVFNTFVTDADGYAAQISYINKVCYTSYSTNALYVNKVNNVNSLEARTMSSTQYGVAKLAGDGALSNTNNGLGIALAPGQSLIIENNKLGLNNSYIDNLIDKKVTETNNYKTVYTAYCDISDPCVNYVPHYGPNKNDYIVAYYGKSEEGTPNANEWIFIYDTRTYYISYTANDSYTYDILQMVHKRSNLDDGMVVVPTLCYMHDLIISNTSAESASSTFTNNYRQYPIYAFKFINSNNEGSYTYFNNNGKLIDYNSDIWNNHLMASLLTFDQHSRYNIVTKNSNNEISYEYGFTSELNNTILLPENSTLSELIDNSNNFTLNNFYNRSVLSVNIDKLSLPTASSTKKGMVSVNTLRGLTVNTNGQLNINAANDTTYGTVKIDNDTIKINENGQLYAKQIENFDELEKLDVETINMLLDLKDKLQTNNLLTTYLTEVNASTNVYMAYNLYNETEIAYYGTKDKIDNAFSAYSQLYDLTVSSLDKSINYTFSTINSNVFNAYNISGVYSDYRYLTISRSIIKDKNIEFLKVDDIEGIKIASTTYNLLPNIILYGKTLFNDRITGFNDISLITKIQKIYSYIKADNDHYIVSDYGYYDRNNKNLYLYIGDICTDESNTNIIGKLACKYNIDLTSDTLRWDIFPFTNTDKCTITSFNNSNHTEYVNIGLSVSKNKQVSLYIKLYANSIVNTIGWLEGTEETGTIKLFYNIPNSGNTKEYMAVSYIHNIYGRINPQESVTSTVPPGGN